MAHLFFFLFFFMVHLFICYNDNSISAGILEGQTHHGGDVANLVFEYLKMIIFIGREDQIYGKKERPEIKIFYPLVAQMTAWSELKQSEPGASSGLLPGCRDLCWFPGHK